MKTLIFKSLLNSLYQRIPKAFGILWQRGVRGDFFDNDALLMHSLVLNIINTVTYIDVVFSRILWHNCSQGGCICRGKAHIMLYYQKKRGKN